MQRMQKINRRINWKVYEYMDGWETFDETTLTPKEAFYSNLNLESISDEDYAHAQKACDVFEIKI